jgi:acyl-CoA thioesterase
MSGDDGRGSGAVGSDDAQRVAEAAAAAMWADDQASQALGMRVDAVGPGRAVLSMTVRADMTNGHGIGHGGFTFALADSAFAFACNSYDRRTVAARCDIAFLAPIRDGDTLVAEAVERHRVGRNGIYDVTVRRGDEVIAEFRGTAREIGGPVSG